MGSTALWMHLLVPLACLGLLAAWAGPLGGDRWLADRIYAWEGHAWALREAWVADTAIHVYGRRLSAAAWTVLLCAWVQASLFRPRWPLRRPVAYLLLAVLASCVAVSLLKSWSNMDCPWDLVRYGGQREFFGLLEARPPGMERGRCFPAGHASAGYAWVALYFFFLAAAPRWRWLGLSTGLALGLVFGISQQLRGAHFLSHDLYTAAICWLIALGLYVAMLHSAQARGRTPDGSGASP
ncbi:MAG: phosphatase PAP2 family protein [Proteobacteria bacterium]|nr:phosphatase PAP2 family protein [Pseudomonadota bacterium]